MCTGSAKRGDNGRNNGTGTDYIVATKPLLFGESWMMYVVSRLCKLTGFLQFVRLCIAFRFHLYYLLRYEMKVLSGKKEKLLLVTRQVNLVNILSYESPSDVQYDCHQFVSGRVAIDCPIGVFGTIKSGKKTHNKIIIFIVIVALFAE